ncbi:PIN domain-like protein [Favolaschia claudopus]|uniref:PIN domain-like protein n=1 Tax=Favolaschia claudopus TaxID=2862362 RepID=A0AAW0AJ87_9AGAR
MQGIPDSAPFPVSPSLPLSSTMGLPGIWKLLEHAVETHNIVQYTTAECFKNNTQDCRPMIIGIDASIWMYQVTEALNRCNTQRGPNPALRTIYHRLAALLQIAAVFVFVFDGPERWDIKRGTRVNTKGHRLTPMFCQLIRHFGFHTHFAPGEADAELGRLSAENIIHAVQTIDSDVFLFGAQRVIYTPKKKTDRDSISVYTSRSILTTPSIGLTRGGLLVFALLAGGDYDPGCPGCGVKTAHAIARGPLGDALWHAASRSPVPTAEFRDFLVQWKLNLCEEFRLDPHGYLGRTYKSIAQVISDTPNFPSAKVIFAYVHPVTSYSRNHNLPRHQTWDVAKPDVAGLAGFCQQQFGWNASTLYAKFSKGLFYGVALQSLIKPHDLHAVLRAHVEFGVSSDEDFPRSSVFRVMKTKQVSYHGQPLLLRQVEMSAGALGLRVKAGIADASAFPTPSLMIKWIPAAIIDYAFPDLVARSRRPAVSHCKRAEKYHKVTTKASNRKPLQGQGSSSSTTLYLSDSTLSECDVIDLTASDEEDI